MQEDDRDRIARKAAAAGQSMQEYSLAVVHRTAVEETPGEFLARHRERLTAAGGGIRMSADEIVQLVHGAREER